MIPAMNMEAQHRKKDPVRLHRQLLESAAMIAGRDGIAALSLNAVAREAGVSKGGLLHHFPNKQALIFALFARLLAMPDEPVLRKCWRDWMLDHLAQGDALDNGPTGTLVRYAADGIWLSELTEGRTMSSEHRQSLVNDLTKMTLPA
ncbi:TetR/AcrR family transcriptional regulator [Klebsiella pneumoniae]|uniref:TetR/AcrR family transcriptional regulator n=1 Tax=Klebsiella pneumoniae TaxID=573 RepID=UPI000E2E38BF|nr:TetR/AcrR family transcriptional regulator [Klebsiella pneumoniae]SXJ10507.1 transcriptional regulator [Klebsiella pneumoniae]